MKRRVCACVSVCLLCCMLALPAHAAEPVESPVVVEAGVEGYLVNIVDFLSTFAPLLQNLSDDSDTQLPILQDIQSSAGSGGSVAVQAPPVTHDLLVPPERPEGSLAATMEEIFGAYTPLTYEVNTYTDSGIVTTTEVVPGLAGMDWPFLGGVFLFSVMLSGLFKLLGVVLR